MAYGTLKADVIQSDTTNVPPQFNGGNGVQVGTLCRAWVNFNGTGTVAIRASFNVSSITDNGTGDYTVNFTTAMPDANNSAQYMLSSSRQFIKTAANGGADPTTTTFRIASLDAAGGANDAAFNLLAFFR
jgi:hypothetical protein